MQRQFVLTLTGPDRIGIVDRVTRLLLDRGGNVETSRMARLGGEFAILMLVSMAAEQFAVRQKAAEELAALGEQVKPALEKLLEDSRDLEVQRQLTRILEHITSGTPPARKT